MKLKYWIAVIISAIFLIAIVYFHGSYQEEPKIKENRGIFISYIEFMKYFDNQNEEGIKQEIKKMVDDVDELGFNRIYLQVRPFSDSIYFSDIYPYSHTISGMQGMKKEVDVLDYFIDLAHQKNIELFAWVNPYRISNQTDISIISKDNPAYQWLDTTKVKIIEGKGIYYNPASSEVIQLINKGMEEIVSNYEVDGILLDDYFYPDDTIDLAEYHLVENTISITDFRLSKVNELVHTLYATVKKYKPNVLFGISPDGNIDNNYEMHYADVKKWLTEDGYVDYIMPQIYYGFYHEVKPFIRTLNEWNDLNQKQKILIPALALYKAGKEDVYAKSGRNEWIEQSNIIQKQIKVVRNLKNYQGFTIFRYDYFLENEQNVNLQQEILGIRALF